MKHRNAAASGVAGAIAVVVLYLLTYASFEPPSYVAAALTTVLIGLVLFIGQKGLSGLVDLVLHGSR